AHRGAAVAMHHYDDGAEGARVDAAQINAGGGRAATLHADLRSVAACQRVVEWAAETLGGLDILANNAGITRNVDFLAMDEATYKDLFELNVRGYFFCAQRAASLMQSRGAARSSISPRSTRRPEYPVTSLMRRPRGQSRR